jgi:hypothetical protein
VKDYEISIQQLINILDRVQLPDVPEVAGTPTLIRVNQAQKQAIKISLVGVEGEQREKQPLPEQHLQVQTEQSFKPGIHGSSKNIDYVVRDITKTHGRVMCIAEQTDDSHFRVVINSGCVKYKKVSHDQELLSWHVSECIIRVLALHTGDPADHKRIDELIDLFYDRLDGVIDGE